MVLSRSARFTLIEMMTVVAVIGVLSAIALPLVYQNQLKAKRAEIPLNVDGLIDAAVGYNAAFDTYGVSAVTWQPGPYWDKAAHPWDDGSIPTVFTDFGWSPDGDIRASYFYDTDDATFVYVVAQSDMDTDAQLYYRRDSINPVTGDHLSPEFEDCLGGTGDTINCF